MRTMILPLALGTLTLAACGSPEPAAEADADTTMAPAESATPSVARANLMTADGQSVGTVTATGTDGSIQISIDATGMPAGEHGVHVHTTGSCSPDFAAAGGHWNPQGTKHGMDSEGGQHAGDMPNLTVAEDGTGTLQYTLQGGATWDGLMDADGSAFIVHAGKDDQTTDPSGDSGDRIACGVFEAG